MNYTAWDPSIKEKVIQADFRFSVSLPPREKIDFKSREHSVAARARQDGSNVVQLSKNVRAHKGRQKSSDWHLEQKIDKFLGNGVKVAARLTYFACNQ